MVRPGAEVNRGRLFAGTYTALGDSLAPGARLAIVDPRKGVPGAGPPDEFRFTPEEIDEELSQAGYEQLVRHDFLPRQNFLSLRREAVRRRTMRAVVEHDTRTSGGFAWSGALLLAVLATAVGTPPLRGAAPNEDLSGAARVLAMDVTARDGIIDLLLIEETDGGAVLRHRRSSDGAVTWTASTIDPGGRAIRTHRRGNDPRIAAIGDQIVVLWTRPGTGRFGVGPLATAWSAAGGRTWTAGANPADDGTTDGHAFLQLMADPEGRFHAYWLDSRDGGQGLRASSSNDGGRTWTANATLDRPTCECCWNEAIAMGGEQLAVLYRDNDPRDMALAVSENGGATWDRRGHVGAFGWGFNGCPHVGGGLGVTFAGSKQLLHAVVWTGKEADAGVHALRSGDGGRSWPAPQRLGSIRARHTDLAARGASVAIVWDEVRDGQSIILAAVSKDHGQTWGAPVVLSSREYYATHPLIVPTGEMYVVFWTERHGDDGLRWRSARL